MKFCVASMNNSQKDLGIELQDIQTLYASHLIGQDKENSLWNELEISEDKMVVILEAARRNSIPGSILAREYNSRLENEGRGNEKIQVVDSDLSVATFSSTLEKELDKIASTVAKFGKNPAGQKKERTVPDSKKSKPRHFDA